jgi:hypothetical protein
MPRASAVYNGVLYFPSINVSGATKMFAYNGTVTTQISNTTGNNTTADSSDRSASCNNLLYFSSNNPNGVQKLFSYDGSAIVQVSNTAGSNAVTDNLTENLICFKNNLYFIASNSSGVLKLFVAQGNQVSQISNTSGSVTVADNPSTMTILNNILYFSANREPAGNVYKLFSYDGSDLRQVSNTSQNTSVDDGIYGFYAFDGFQTRWANSRFVPYNNKLYFAGKNSSGGNKLFVFDGASVIQVSNSTGTQATNDYPDTPAVFNNKLYFTSNNSGGYAKLYSLCDAAASCTP